MLCSPAFPASRISLTGGMGSKSGAAPANAAVRGKGSGVTVDGGFLLLQLTLLLTARIRGDVPE